MTTRQDILTLADALREIHGQDPERSETAIEDFLGSELKDLDRNERLQVIGQLMKVFPSAARSTAQGSDNDLMDRLVPMLLGIGISGRDLGTSEIIHRLADSLNTIFNMLNDLIHLINSTLGGGSVGEETIRHIIGGSLEAEGKVQSIEEYLGQIRKAFLTAQQSSKEAARTVAGQILAELDPKDMESSITGFKIGPMKKAEAYELFEEKYNKVKKWYDSERFLLDFLRQFEKNCQKSFT